MKFAPSCRADRGVLLRVAPVTCSRSPFDSPEACSTLQLVIAEAVLRNHPQKSPGLDDDPTLSIGHVSGTTGDGWARPKKDEERGERGKRVFSVDAETDRLSMVCLN